MGGIAADVADFQSLDEDFLWQSAADGLSRLASDLRMDHGTRAVRAAFQPLDLAGRIAGDRVRDCLLHRRGFSLVRFESGVRNSEVQTAQYLVA